MASQPLLKMSSEEFLEWERTSATKHEFYNGEVFAMPGASAKHNSVSFNLHGMTIHG